MPVHFIPIRSHLFTLGSQGYRQDENKRASMTADTSKAVSSLDRINQSIIWCAIFSSSFL